MLTTELERGKCITPLFSEIYEITMISVML